MAFNWVKSCNIDDTEKFFIVNSSLGINVSMMESFKRRINRFMEKIDRLF